jgi:hypothetical protein
LPLAPRVVWDAPVLLLDGMPLHPLIIHAVVVLLPLAALGSVACAVRASWRERLAWPTLLLAVVGAAAVPAATLSGSQLQVALGGGSPLVAEHAARAATLLPAAVVYALLAVAVVVVGRRARVGATAGGHSAPAEPSRLPALVAVLAAVAGVVVTGLVMWIGHAGSLAVWSGVLP